MPKARKQDYLIECRYGGEIEHERSCVYVVSSSFHCTCGAVEKWSNSLNLDEERPMIEIPRYFSKKDIDPLDDVEWEKRDARIIDAEGNVVFEQRDVTFPKSWSQTATNIVAQKYFHGELGTPEREDTLSAMINRVVGTIAEWGVEDGYFLQENGDVFRDELAYLVVNQMMAFNSPVWFNVGVDDRPQCSACFINSVEDSMESILELARTEGMLFKHGSGTGTNLSTLRSSHEGLSGGGTASGPVSFMRGFDAFAGAIKSGGKTRRAAKMVILNVDHPDVVKFIECKAREEEKAHVLIAAGYDSDFNADGGAYDSVSYQNANHSVRVNDAFMKDERTRWATVNVTDGLIKGANDLTAKEVLRKIAAAAHACGDPGVQFDDVINAWHTCPNSGRINASNPCSEYMFLDDSACNLASLNLRAFQKTFGDEFDDMTSEFNIEAFEHAVELTILAMEIIVDRASYPTEKIAENSRRFRPLGLGYANLGGLLMARGLPYDSDEGRALAAALTSIMTATAYRMSAQVARYKGAFEGYEKNRAPFMNVMRKHARAVEPFECIWNDSLQNDILNEIYKTSYDALTLGEEHGFRNAQVTVLAPTGTIALMMDCDTTGIEPDTALVKVKQLVGGGMLSYSNSAVVSALKRLGYNRLQAGDIVSYIHEHGTVVGCPDLKEDHLPVFACSLDEKNGIDYRGHLRMMAEVQPFLSGAISKTVNLPRDCTVEDVEQVFVEAWRMELKAITVYRDGCKQSQPLSAMSKTGAVSLPEETVQGPPAATRNRLPAERTSVTHKFSVGGHEGYVTVGLYENGRPGEVFVRMAKEGSVVAGLMDALATAVSLGLQHGIPLDVFWEKFRGTRFEPSGFTGNRELPNATSVLDYLFRWLHLKFVESESENVVEERSGITCSECGHFMMRNGSCFVCTNCGVTSGCS